MNCRRIFCVAGLVLLATASSLVWPRGPKEPIYEGKGLFRWIAEAEVANMPATDEMARVAVNAAGTNALEYLLHQFAHHESPLSKRFRQIRSYFSNDPTLNYEPIHNPVVMAQRGIVLMSPRAAPALPTLASYLDDPRRDFYAVLAMGGCGEAALPYLLKVISSTDLGHAGAHALQEIAKTSEAAVPPLIKLVEASLDYNKGGKQRQRTNYFGSSGPRPINLSAAVGCLYGVKARPDLTIPVLSNALSLRDSDVQLTAAAVLGSLGPAANPTLPKLRELLKTSELWEMRIVSNAMVQIDPAVFELPRR